MSTAQVAPPDVEPLYGSPVSDTQGIPHDLLERARATVEEVRRAQAAYDKAIADRYEAVNAALAATPREVSDNEVARQVGLEPSTFRSITDDLRRRRRARRP